MATTLKEQLGTGQKRGQVVRDATQVLESEVKGKGGVSGFAIKAAFKVLSGVKPGFVPHVIDSLLDDFLDALDPFYQTATSGGQAPGAEVLAQKEKAAQALLSVADRRVAATDQEVVKKAYEKLRGSAQKQVVEAIPAVASLLGRHATS